MQSYGLCCTLWLTHNLQKQATPSLARENYILWSMRLSSYWINHNVIRLLISVFPSISNSLMQLDYRYIKFSRLKIFRIVAKTEGTKQNTATWNSQQLYRNTISQRLAHFIKNSIIFSLFCCTIQLVSITQQTSHLQIPNSLRSPERPLTTK